MPGIGRPFVDGMLDIEAIARKTTEDPEGATVSTAADRFHDTIGEVIRPIIRDADGKVIKRGQVIIHQRLKTKAELTAEAEALAERQSVLKGIPLPLEKMKTSGSGELPTASVDLKSQASHRKRERRLSNRRFGGN